MKYIFNTILKTFSWKYTPILFIGIFIFMCSTSYAKGKAHADTSTVAHYNITKDTWIVSQNINKTRPLASMTKLMTAMVALDYSKDLNRKLTLKTRVGSRLPAKEFTRNELFHAMLIRSDNAAAETIADDYPNGRAAFIKAMNAKAKAMNLSSTEFKDPTGLSGSNLSSGTDMVDIVKEASNYDLIRKTSIKKQTIIEAHYKTKIRSIVLDNTNKPLLFQFDDIVISKTGFTNSAGWCVALLVEHWTKRAPQEPNAMNKFLSYFDGEPDRNIARGDLEQHVIIIMGAKNKSERIAEVQRIMYNHINDQQISQWDYDWKIDEKSKE